MYLKLNRMKTIVFVATTALIFSSCSSNNRPKAKSGEIVSSIAEGDQSDDELKQELLQTEKDEIQRKADEAANVTTFTFDKMEHDFGNVTADTDNGTEFIVTNTGDKPLVIENVKASCGCTMPQKPENPIAPGKSDVIKVNFHPGLQQLNEIRKTITVTANTEPRLSTVSVRAFVEEAK